MRTARSLPHGGGVLSRGVSVQGCLCLVGFCKEGSLSREGLCLGGLFSGGSLSGRGLCRGGVLCLGRETLSRGSLSEGGLLGRPLPPWTEWQKRVKPLPCPKLRLRAVIKSNHMQMLFKSTDIVNARKKLGKVSLFRHIPVAGSRTAKSCVASGFVGLTLFPSRKCRGWVTAASPVEMCRLSARNPVRYMCFDSIFHFHWIKFKTGTTLQRPSTLQNRKM